MNVRVSGLRDLLELADSGTWGEDGDPNTGAPVLRSSNIQGGQLDLTDFAWRVIPENDRERCRLAPGDIIITKSSGSANLIGKCCIFTAEDSNGPYYFSNFTLRLRVRDGVADHRWIYYWLISERGRAALASLNNTTSGLRNLSVPRYLEQKLPTPPLEEQRRIAAILDRADAIRRKRQEAIALAEQLLRSTFLDMFGDPVTNLMGWPRKSLREVALVTGGLQVTDKRIGLPIEVPYLRVANVYRDELSLGELKVLRVTNQELGRAQLTAGDILIVEGHGNAEEIGRAAIWDGSVAPCVHQNHLIRVSVNRQTTDPVYLNAFINSAAGRRHMQRMGKTTSGLNTISTENVRSMEVLLPPLELQLRFASCIASARGFLQKQRSVFACAEDLFNSLVQRAFTGQL